GARAATALLLDFPPGVIAFQALAFLFEHDPSGQAREPTFPKTGFLDQIGACSSGIMRHWPAVLAKNAPRVAPWTPKAAHSWRRLRQVRMPTFRSPPSAA